MPDMKIKLGVSNGINVGKMGILGGGVSVPPPAQPTGLTATPASATQINLAWTDNATNETAYRVYRSTDGSTYSQVGTDLAADANSYNDTTPTGGTTYYYKVAAVNSGGETRSAAATANTLTLNLISYWKLDETSDSSVQVTRNDSHGSNHLGDSQKCASASGRINNGMSNAGTGKYLNINDNVSLSTGDVHFCISAWLYITQEVSRAVLGKTNSDTAGGYEYAFYYYAASEHLIGFAVGNGTSVQAVKCTGFGALSLNTWYFVVGWHDTTLDTINISVNGTVTSAARTVTPADTAHPFRIGGNAEVTGIGAIDEVAFWKGRFLSADERAGLYNGGTGLQYPF